MTDLYRFYNADNELLYIGISLHAVHRATQHRRTKSWWPEVARMTVEQVPGDRKRAESAEYAAIKRERPKYNILHTDGAITHVPQTTCAKSDLDALVVPLVAQRLLEERLQGNTSTPSQILRSLAEEMAREERRPTRDELADAEREEGRELVAAAMERALNPAHPLHAVRSVADESHTNESRVRLTNPDAVERLIAQAVAQGFTPKVTDREALKKAATVLRPPRKRGAS